MSPLHQITISVMGQMLGAFLMIMGAAGIVNTLQFASFRREGDTDNNHGDFD